MIENKLKVLFVCIHNSARSQIAEAFLKKYGSDRFEAESAGLEAGRLNPLAVEVMREIGIDISGNKTKSAFDFFKQGKRYHYVITVCDESKAQKCPVFPGKLEQLHWGIPESSSFTGTWEEKLEMTRAVRDEIKKKVTDFIVSVSSTKK